MIKSINISLFYIMLLLLSGCETYHTFYGESATDINRSAAIYRLDLSFQQLTELPTNIHLKTEIRTLNLSGNPEIELEKALPIICKLPKLNVLLLNSLQLKALPKAIKNCQSLTQLSLVNNPDLNIKAAISSLFSLKLSFLDLSKNQLKQLPNNLTTLTTLKHLRLSHNQLTSSQAYQILGKLPHLSSLWLDNNQLKQIPNSIQQLKTINYLYLDNNVLTDLPREIQYLPRLTALWLGHNCFTEIPAALINVKAYMVLLNHNEISDIGDAFKEEEFILKGIVLDHNLLSDKQRKDAKKIFKNTFIYSDKNQRLKNKNSHSSHDCE